MNYQPRHEFILTGPLVSRTLLVEVTLKMTKLTLAEKHNATRSPRAVPRNELFCRHLISPFKQVAFEWWQFETRHTCHCRRPTNAKGICHWVACHGEPSATYRPGRPPPRLKTCVPFHNAIKCFWRQLRALIRQISYLNVLFKGTHRPIDTRR